MDKKKANKTNLYEWTKYVSGPEMPEPEDGWETSKVSWRGVDVMITKMHILLNSQTLTMKEPITMKVLGPLIGTEGHEKDGLAAVMGAVVKLVWSFMVDTGIDLFHE